MDFIGYYNDCKCYVCTEREYDVIIPDPKYFYIIDGLMIKNGYKIGTWNGKKVTLFSYTGEKYKTNRMKAKELEEKVNEYVNTVKEEVKVEENRTEESVEPETAVIELKIPEIDFKDYTTEVDNFFHLLEE